VNRRVKGGRYKGHGKANAMATATADKNERQRRSLRDRLHVGWDGEELALAI
jgi:hypothetical protein